MYCVWQVVKTPTIILNNPALWCTVDLSRSSDEDDVVIVSHLECRISLCFRQRFLTNDPNSFRIQKTDEMVSTFNYDILISPSLVDLKCICLCVVMEYPTRVCRHILPTKIYFLHQSCCSTNSDLLFSSYYWKTYKTLWRKMTYCRHRIRWIPMTGSNQLHRLAAWSTSHI